MSTKSNSRLHKIQNLMRRHDWKQAYQETRFLARKSFDPELENILITTLWNWIKDQISRDQRESATENIHKLLRFATIPAEIQNEFPPVFRSLGLNALLPEQLRLNTASPEMQAELADIFLIHGDQSPDLHPETIADAKCVQEALRKIECKEDDEAIACLRPISFRSPLAEWRLFLRGLMDYYHGEDDKTEESWRRLSRERAPWRIADRLRQCVIEKPSASRQGGVPSRGIDAQEPLGLLATLQTLDYYVKQGKYKELVGRFQVFRNQYQKTESMVFDRVLELVHSQLSRHAAPDVVRQFIERNVPLPIDPHGNLTLFWLADRNESIEKCTYSWLKHPSHYLKVFAKKDIDRIDVFSPEMKARAKAIIYLYSAKQFTYAYKDSKDALDNIQISLLLQEINDSLEDAIASDPTYIESYDGLKTIFFLDNPGNKKVPFPVEIAKINERLLKHIPEDIDAITYLFNYHCYNGRTEDAQIYLDKLQTLTPLSKNTAIYRFKLLFNRIHDALGQQNFALAEKFLSELENMSAHNANMNCLNISQLSLAYICDELQRKKDGFTRYVELAKKAGAEKPLPLIFSILVEGQGYSLPEKTIHRLESDWAREISGRCHGNTAGMLSDLALNITIRKSQNPQIKKYLNEACAFVNRAGQVQWHNEKDLYHACCLLWFFIIQEKKEEYRKTFTTLVRKGYKNYPNALGFNFFDIEIDYLTGNRWGRYYARERLLNRYHAFIRKYAAYSEDPDYIILMDAAKMRVDKLEVENPFYAEEDDFYDETDDDPEDIEDTFPGNNMSLDTMCIPPEIRKMIKQLGGFPPEIRESAEQGLPEKFGELRPLILACFEECALNDLPDSHFPEMLIEKIKKVPILQQKQLFKRLQESGMFKDFVSDQFEEYNDSLPFSGKEKNRKKKKR